MAVWWQTILVIIVSYFCGNVSFARLISKAKNNDITKMGSGNPGSTNILRNYGLKFGVLNLALDMLKGFIPSIVSFYLFGHNYVMLYIAGISSMLGHIYPVIFKFKGGKGIATMLGLFLASNPIATLIMIAIGTVIWAIFEYGSVVSFLCITSLAVIEGIKARTNLCLVDRKIVCLILFAIFVFTWYAHRKNIERLLLGKESKASLIKKTKKKLKSKEVV
ncbi:MAG: glycerol-3-phosphate 1-O-acyltransferase PlsY [Clostridia bacterium]|nr:glycerol-3-phosphate 1-O-acyltransferase PlsY [Clostridia bacterium]